MYGVTQIEAYEEVALISFKKIPFQTGLLADLFQEYADAGINVDMISQTSPLGGRVSISFTCFSDDLLKVLSISKTLQEKYPDLRPMVISGNSKINLYGEEMPKMPGVFARAVQCLKGTPAELLLVTTSESDISLLVADAHREDALAALRAEFQIT